MNQMLADQRSIPTSTINITINKNYKMGKNKNRNRRNKAKGEQKTDQIKNEIKGQEQQEQLKDISSKIEQTKVEQSQSMNPADVPQVKSPQEKITTQDKKAQEIKIQVEQTLIKEQNPLIKEQENIQSKEIQPKIQIEQEQIQNDKNLIEKTEIKQDKEISQNDEELQKKPFNRETWVVQQQIREQANLPDEEKEQSIEKWKEQKKSEAGSSQNIVSSDFDESQVISFKKKSHSQANLQKNNEKSVSESQFSEIDALLKFQVDKLDDKQKEENLEHQQPKIEVVENNQETIVVIENEIYQQQMQPVKQEIIQMQENENPKVQVQKCTPIGQSFIHSEQIQDSKAIKIFQLMEENHSSHHLKDNQQILYYEELKPKEKSISEIKQEQVQQEQMIQFKKDLTQQPQVQLNSKQVIQLEANSGQSFVLSQEKQDSIAQKAIKILDQGHQSHHLKQNEETIFYESSEQLPKIQVQAIPEENQVIQNNFQEQKPKQEIQEKSEENKKSIEQEIHQEKQENKPEYLSKGEIKEEISVDNYTQIKQSTFTPDFLKQSVSDNQTAQLVLDEPQTQQKKVYQQEPEQKIKCMEDPQLIPTLASNKQNILRSQEQVILFTRQAINSKQVFKQKIELLENDIMIYSETDSRLDDFEAETFLSQIKSKTIPVPDPALPLFDILTMENQKNILNRPYITWDIFDSAYMRNFPEQTNQYKPQKCYSIIPNTFSLSQIDYPPQEVSCKVNVEQYQKKIEKEEIFQINKQIHQYKPQITEKIISSAKIINQSARFQLSFKQKFKLEDTQNKRHFQNEKKTLSLMGVITDTFRRLKEEERLDEEYSQIQSRILIPQQKPVPQMKPRHTLIDQLEQSKILHPVLPQVRQTQREQKPQINLLGTFQPLPQNNFLNRSQPSSKLAVSFNQNIQSPVLKYPVTKRQEIVHYSSQNSSPQLQKHVFQKIQVHKPFVATQKFHQVPRVNVKIVKQQHFQKPAQYKTEYVNKTHNVSQFASPKIVRNQEYFNATETLPQHFNNSIQSDKIHFLSRNQKLKVYSKDRKNQSVEHESRTVKVKNIHFNNENDKVISHFEEFKSQYQSGQDRSRQRKKSRSPQKLHITQKLSPKKLNTWISPSSRKQKSPQKQVPITRSLKNQFDNTAIISINHNKPAKQRIKLVQKKNKTFTRNYKQYNAAQNREEDDSLSDVKCQLLSNKDRNINYMK